MKYDIVIGIETHIQLNTQTKMFCGCSTDSWKATANTHTCPTCLGLPGALPVMNKMALDKAMLVAMALHSNIPDRMKFDRKNYFYPDLAKGYQISQYDEPLALGGYVEVDDARITLVRAHLEEDVGKLTHAGPISLVDFNKGGTPLMEIVSEPVMHSAVQAKAYVQALRQLVRYLEVNDGNMEQGVIRADVNVSLQTPGKWHFEDGEFLLEDGYELNNRVEIKNLNSFRNIERAINYEVSRQEKELEAGLAITQETRGWDEVRGVTTSQRTKEEAHDYRYFPEPDLPPVAIDESWKHSIAKMLPELPGEKRQRFEQDLGLSSYTARLLCEEQGVAAWFEKAVSLYMVHDCKKSAKIVANWVLGDLAKLQNETGILLSDSGITPELLAGFLEYIDEGKVSVATVKQVLSDHFSLIEDKKTIKDFDNLLSSESLMRSDDDITPIAQSVLLANPEVVASIKAGKVSAIQFLVGQVMKESRGRAHPEAVRSILEKLLA
jgi:aspartyl-tRNA(Asn)/glutamyl-tRNA(Gln) amidotransferase subunit B